MFRYGPTPVGMYAIATYDMKLFIELLPACSKFCLIKMFEMLSEGYGYADDTLVLRVAVRGLVEGQLLKRGYNVKEKTSERTKYAKDDHSDRT